MTRLIILTILNLSLPFLVYYLKRRITKMWQRRNEPHVIDVTPEEHITPTVKLVIIGLILLVISLVALRFSSPDTPSESYTRSKTLSADY